MNEAQTEFDYIDPALRAAGWGVVEGSYVRKQFPITQGRLLGSQGKRAKPLKADYVLQYKNRRLAVIEAKARDVYYTQGVGQAKDYADRLNIRFTYSTNGQQIYAIDMQEGIEGDIERFPTLDELWDMTFPPPKKQNEVAIANDRERLFAVPFEDRGGTWQPRYYQDNAITKVLEAVAAGKDKDNPQLIFESLNSTGLDLSQADLIRNYILMGQEITLQTELYEKYWFPMEQSYGNDYSSHFDWFMRDYLSVKTGTIPKIHHVYDDFKSYVQSSGSPYNIKEIVEDIFRYSGYYVNMVLHKEPDHVLLNGFKQISRLKVDVSYPFFLPVYHDYIAGEITRDEFYETICLVENYIFRRAICGIPTNSLNKTFATLYKAIQKDNYLESFKAAFQTMESYKRFPSDAEFEKEIVAKDIYNFRNRLYLFGKLENFNRKEHVNVDDYTIEHIMPQNPALSREWQNMLGENWKEIQEQYLHTLGNLTLTGYNSELSDRPFTLKKTIQGGFNDSPIRLNEFLRKIDIWNEDQIQKRAKELANKAKQIWFAPNLPQEILEKYKPEEKEAIYYTIEQYEFLKGEMLELYLLLKKRILNIDSSVKEEYKKLYIAFKSSTNFVDIVPQKSRLRLTLNIEFPDIIDPKGLCRDVSGLGRWGNGDVEVGISNINELDDIMDLIQQAFDKQVEYS